MCRPRLRSLPRPLGAAFALAAMITAPLLYYALTGFQSESIIVPSTSDGDVMNLLVPTRVIAVGGSTFASTSAKFFSDLPDQGLYLGIPTLVIVGLFALGAPQVGARRASCSPRSSRRGRSLGTGALGRRPRRARLAALERLVERCPPRQRAAVAVLVYVALAAAVMVALWIGATPGQDLPVPVRPAGARGRGADAARVAVRLPPPSGALVVLHDRAVQELHPAQRNVAIFPFGVWDYSTLWQAESDSGSGCRRAT